MKIIWTQGTLRSLRCVRKYIAHDNQDASASVAARIRRSVRHLETFPHAGRPALRSGTREIVVAGLPYVVVYRVADTAVQIVRVFHTSQQRH